MHIYLGFACVTEKSKHMSRPKKTFQVNNFDP